VKPLYTFLILLLFAATPATAQITNEECMKYHHGNFVDGSLSYIHIVRDSVTNTQVETDTRTGKKSTFSIVWLNACTYELTMISSDDKKERKASKAVGTLRVVITAYDDDGYSYIATASGIPGPIRGSVKWKKD
jgi:hypothetical protein